jgi:ribose 5-phosphate isomerase B
MKIFIGGDHASFELKQKLISFIEGLGHHIHDKGPFDLTEGDDYPDFVILVAREVADLPDQVKGIILGGSGQGEAIVANRFKGVRAAVYYGGSMDIVKLSREHNDANVLSLGARFITVDEAKKAVQMWLETDFSGDSRHVRRLEKIERLTQ